MQGQTQHLRMCIPLVFLHAPWGTRAYIAIKIDINTPMDEDVNSCYMNLCL